MPIEFNYRQPEPEYAIAVVCMICMASWPVPQSDIMYGQAAKCLRCPVGAGVPMFAALKPEFGTRTLIGVPSPITTQFVRDYNAAL